MARAPQTKPTLVLFVRHGLTATTGSRLPGQAAGLHLSPAGREMAEVAGQRIASLGTVAAVYASPLERARETAAPIARAVGRRVRTEADLADSDTGSWTNQPLSRLRKKPEWSRVVSHPSGFRFPDGESFLETQARVVGAVDRLRSRHVGETIVLVSHAEPIRLALAQALGTHLDHFQRIVIAPCSISVVVYTAEAPGVLLVNSTSGELQLRGG
jgi:probable phosphoglycerate mutase